MLQIVRVSGPSMSPVLKDGDIVFARRGSVRPGDVVLARFRSMPERLVIKRAVRPVGDGGWWLASDNRFAGGDSGVHGAADVLARVVLSVRRLRVRRVR